MSEKDETKSRIITVQLRLFKYGSISKRKEICLYLFVLSCFCLSRACKEPTEVKFEHRYI